MSVKISTNTDVGGLHVNTDGQAAVALNADPVKSGTVQVFSQNDDGSQTGTPHCASPETDEDYRLRSNSDILLDQEDFCYTSQNTGKHTYANTTMTATWTVAGVTLNGAGVTTTATGVTVGTQAEFPLVNAASLYCEVGLSFSNQPVSNCNVDFGMFRRGATTQYAPADGIYFRLNSAGLQGVVNYNGTETTTSVFSGFSYLNNQKRRYIITITQKQARFWVDNVLYGSISVPTGQGKICLSPTLPFSVRQAHPGTAGGILQTVINNYGVTLGGPMFLTALGEAGNRAFGSYQGLSGNTMGSLANYANSANPTAAVPTNTTAVLGSGLGGQFWETASLAVNTDGIICSYQVPAATTAVAGKRLRINGVSLASFIQTVIAGGPFNNQYSLAFGHTSVSLATTESAIAKAPRRIPLPFVQTVTAAQAVSTAVAQGCYSVYFENPIYVNPGEFVALVVKRIGTVGTSGVIAHMVTFDYGWE